MSTNMNAAVLIAAMSITTILLRFLPFLVFKKETPPYISYLGKVLPPAIIGMLVIYCLKDVTPTASPYGIPELIAAACVVILQVWKRNSLISILTGTVVYMDYGSREMGNHKDMLSCYIDTANALMEQGVLLTSRIVPNGDHCEASWEEQIPMFMQVLFYNRE